MVGLFLRSAEEEEGQVGMALAEAADQANVIVQRPAAQRQILRPARSDMETQHGPVRKILPGDELRRPGTFGVRQKDFIAMLCQQRLGVEQGKQGKQAANVVVISE